MEYLYHYTNVETFKLIVESSKFRFNSLANVDDEEEMETNNFGNLGRFCYVSCWTDKHEESIPLWKEYTTPTEGIRLKLPKNIFKTLLDCGISNEQFLQLGASQMDLNNFHGWPYTNGLAEIERENKVIFMPRIVNLFPVTYTKDPELLHYTVFHEDDNNSQLETNLIGKFKRLDWKYQSEWRYKLFTFPFSLFSIIQNPQIMQDQAKILQTLKSGEIESNFFDIPFDIKSLDNIEITTSPVISIEASQKLKEILRNIPNYQLIPSEQRWRK
ncbi:DUF2971 domain-containing protein [Lapidilactobacillus wuchangensis]|uniref:DUF2971 domain-containing protein n=1 Tax=Lapidilactobacillus wuchangensis TaxID=2486001 RepID=UPI000F7A45B0|nr:DUF2971 domain-containing protein [Lapidilactobacillus wuchangensis]